MNIYHFLEMYEPGEYSPPRFKLIKTIREIDKHAVAMNYSDRVDFAGEEWFVFKIKHSFGDSAYGSTERRYTEYYLTKRVSTPFKGDFNV